MSSVTYTTPAFLKALGNLAKENQVSNKEFKAKLAHKANRVKQLQCQRKIADQMDKELTKLEKNAAKEQAKQDKMDAKQAKIAEKETKKQAKEAKIAEKEAKKQAKEAKIAEKEAKKQARVVTTDTDSDDNVEDEDVAVKTVVKKAAKQSKQVKESKQAKDDEKAAAKQAKVDEKAAAKQSKQTKKSEKSKAEKNDRADIIRSICEQLGSSYVHEQQCRTGKI